jgi:hypothetical protein
MKVWQNDLPFANPGKAPRLVRLSLIMGFSDRQLYFRKGSVIPLRLSVQNPGMNVFSGNIRIFTDQKKNSYMNIPVNAEPGKVWNALLPFEYSGAERTLTATLFSGSSAGIREVDTAVSNLQPLERADRFLLLADSEREAREYLGSDMRGAARNREIKAMSQFYAADWLSELPVENPLYFSTLDAIVLSPGFRISAATSAALMDYVRNGGNLVMPLLDGNVLIDVKSSLCPWTITVAPDREFGSDLLNLEDLLSKLKNLKSNSLILDRIRSGLSEAGLISGPEVFQTLLQGEQSIKISSEGMSRIRIRIPVVGIDGLSTSDRVIYASGYPVAVSRSVGRGHIWALTADMGICPWLRIDSNSPSLIDLIVSSRGDCSFVDFNGDNLLGQSFPDPLEMRSEALGSALEAGVVFSIPGPMWTAAFLGGYIFLGVIVNHLAMRRTRRPEVAWIFMIILSVVFTTGLLRGGMGDVGNGSSMTSITFRLTDPESGFEKSMFMGALFSTSRTSFLLEAPELFSFRTLDASAGTAASVYGDAGVSLTEHGLSVRDVQVRQRSLRFFKGTAFSPARPFDRVTLKKSTITTGFFVDNLSPSPTLVNAFVWNGKILFFPGLNPGSSELFSINKAFRDVNSIPVPEGVNAEVFNDLCKCISEMSRSWQGPMWMALHSEEGLTIRVSDSRNSNIVRRGYTAAMIDLTGQMGMWRQSLDRVTGEWVRHSDHSPLSYGLGQGEGYFWFIPPRNMLPNSNSFSGPSPRQSLPQQAHFDPNGFNISSTFENELFYYTPGIGNPGRRNVLPSKRRSGSDRSSLLTIYNFEKGKYEKFSDKIIFKSFLEPVTGMVRVKLKANYSYSGKQCILMSKLSLSDSQPAKF